MEKQYKPVPDCEALRYKGTPEKPDIKIFVSHRIDLDSETIDNPLYIPVRCGAVYDERENVEMLGDDTGDNISDRRMTFNELTIMYWAWKNVKADYYGLCHYRRYLSFSRNQHYLKNQFQLVEETSITGEACERYGLNEEAISKMIENRHADIMLPELFDIAKINNVPGYTHKKRYYQNIGKELTDSSVEKLLDVISDRCPEYYDATKSYFSQEYAYFCNCFLMKKEIFDEYCEWLFGILFELEPKIDYNNLSMNKSRILGFLSEDLFSIYFMENITKRNWNLRELQLVIFNNTTATPMLKPAFDENIVPIVVSSDDFYAPYMGVLIQSIIENSHCENNYDIIILHTDISERNRKLLQSLIRGKDNFSIRFTDISESIGSRTFSVWAHYKKYNVYRLVAPEILACYDKALYFDSDIVVEEDVANLYKTDLGNNLIAAVPDIRYHSWSNEDENDLRIYAKEVLKLPDTHLYFNSGVLVYNLAEFRKTYTSDYMLNYCAQRHWRYIDQDVLNITCADKTLFLPQKWNVLISVDNFATESKAPLNLYTEFASGYKDPSVVHFAGNFMPCMTPMVDFYWSFWRYARNTPFYEILIYRMMKKHMEFIQTNPVVISQQTPIDGRSEARIIADVLLPVGSKRRRFAKRILPKGSLRWRLCKQIYYIFAPQYRPKKQ